MQTKKPAIKKITWFIGLYLASLLAFGLFHWLSQLFIELIK